MSSNPLPHELAAKAESIINSVSQTDYQHTDNIDPDAGVYDCDCNGFVGYILETSAPAHYALVPREDDQPRPRAFEYHDFFASLPPEAPDGWHRILRFADARRGDIVAWRFPLIEAGHDTGHVVFLAETPSVQEDGTFAVRVYDSAAEPHFEDTRGSGDGQFPSGVGTGFINFQVDEDDSPTAFQFAPGDAFETFPIAVGRTEPLTS